MEHSIFGICQNNRKACAQRLQAHLNLASLIAIFAITLTMLGGSTSTTTAQEPGLIAAPTPASTVRPYPFRPKRSVDKDDRPQSASPVNGSTITPGPAGAHLTYYGGPAVSSINIVVVYYGNGSYLPALSTGLPAFYSAITNGTYMDMLSEYSTQGVAGGGTTGNELIQRGGTNAFIGSYIITPSLANSGTTIDDTQVQAELLAQINASHLPTPTYDASGNADTLYMIYFPPGMTITSGGTSSCQSGGFCAYHGTIPLVSSQNILYGVMPDMQSPSGCFTGCGNSTVFNNYTSVASHEFSETITDAAVGIAPSLAPPLAWYDNNNNDGEIGDICNAIQGTADGYTVQAEWSNLQNGCALGPVTFAVSAPATATSGSSFSVTVQTHDSAGASLSSYLGTIHFSSTDPSATLPADYTFTGADAGVHTFTGVVLNSAGIESISATGTVNVGFKGTSSAITVTSGVAASPYFNLAGGTYHSPQSLILTDPTPGATIYYTYTASGATPTTASTVYAGPITINTSGTVEAIATAPGFSQSHISSKAYVYSALSPAAPPFFSLAGGTYNTPHNLTLTDSTPSSTIYYTTNGSAPTTSSTVYSAPITIAATETVKAAAIAPGFSLGPASSKSYVYTPLPVAASPFFSLAGGHYTTPQTLKLTDSTPGATIYYTTNGTNPTTASTPYTAPITISASETVKAIAAAPGYANSNPSAKAYTIP